MKKELLVILWLLAAQLSLLAQTKVRGQVLDAASMLPLPGITVGFPGTKAAVQTDGQGKYVLSSTGSFSRVSFSFIGYHTLVSNIRPGENQILNITLASASEQLQEVTVRAGKRSHYRNKDNPAVALIQQVIDHKDNNRMLSTDYLQYNQYERIGFSFFDLSAKFLKSPAFRKYGFLLDSEMRIVDTVRTALPVYMGEKYSQVYSRNTPPKKITILKAHKQVDYGTLIDTQALDIYLNRLYGNPDIYANNIFILTNQFLSPIADHAPDYYKFFITDTLTSDTAHLIELSFTPRNKGDLLFEGKIYITMDGRYAVKADHLELNKHININFVRRMDIRQDFKQDSGGRFYLTKTEVQSDFGQMKDQGMKIFGERTVFFSGYKFQQPMPSKFYEGPSEQTLPEPDQNDPGFWISHRTDTLSAAQTRVYRNLDSLQKMPSFKRTMWMARFVLAAYGDFGPFELGPNGSFYSFNRLEGSRIALGGRTTPVFDHHVYLEGYIAFGFRDHKPKLDIGAAYSFNGNSPQGYPNNYLKASYQYDTDIPGQNFLIDKFQSILGSFTRGTNDLWQYNRISRLDYIRDLENHFSFNLGFKYWNQRPALGLIFQAENGPAVNSLSTAELHLGLRYAPHEQIFMGTVRRHTIPGKYPIFNVQAIYGMKGVFGGYADYLNLSAAASKRVYLSQLGYTDMTILGGYIAGKVQFPYLAIPPANQTYQYDPGAYNNMNFLEFVSDHYAGLSLTHSFGGFLLNKVPLISHLKLREFLSFKVLYGGLREENYPVNSPSLFRFPSGASGNPVTFPLGSTPYTELGVGVGNIFKVLRLDLIRRFGYLDHQNTAPLGLRFTIAAGL